MIKYIFINIQGKRLQRATTVQQQISNIIEAGHSQINNSGKLQLVQQ